METRVGGFGGAVPGTGDAVHDVRIPTSRITAKLAICSEFKREF